jgi:hypothetical protein
VPSPKRRLWRETAKLPGPGQAVGVAQAPPPDMLSHVGCAGGFIGFGMNCPGRKPPFVAVTRRVCPRKSAIRNRFTVENAVRPGWAPTETPTSRIGSSTCARRARPLSPTMDRGGNFFAFTKGYSVIMYTSVS